MVDLMEVMISKSQAAGNDFLPSLFEYLLKTAAEGDIEREASMMALMHLSEKVEDGNLVS